MVFFIALAFGGVEEELAVAVAVVVVLVVVVVDAEEEEGELEGNDGARNMINENKQRKQ